jgi:large subunit ribosomal protein L10
VVCPPRRVDHDGGDTLNRQEKAEAIRELSERMAATDTVIAADYRGLTVREMAELRIGLAESETQFTVVKNTLARRAAAETGREALIDHLTGPTGLAWVAGDPAAAAKALDAFAGAHPEGMTIKGGLLEGAPVSPAEIAHLAKLPGREQLLGQLAGGIAGPLTGLAGGLNDLIGGLARSLGALQAQRAAEAPADA